MENKLMTAREGHCPMSVLTYVTCMQGVVKSTALTIEPAKHAFCCSAMAIGYRV